MGVLKKWRQKRQAQQQQVAVDDTSPTRLFKFSIGRLHFARDPLLLSIAFHRRLFPNEPIGAALSRLWWRHGDDLKAGDVVQISPQFSPNIGGCFMIVEDCGDKNVFGYILAPSKQGRVGIDMEVPITHVRLLGRPFWKSDRVMLLGSRQ
jgi:hypothetical protein